MTRHYTDMGSASDSLNQISRAARSTTQIWVVTRHQYGISTLIPQRSFGGETNSCVVNVGCFLRLQKAKKKRAPDENQTHLSPSSSRGALTTELLEALW